MKLHQRYQVSTTSGTNSVELYHGKLDLVSIRKFSSGPALHDRPIVAVSNLLGDYAPSGFMGSMIKEFGIDVKNLPRELTYGNRDNGEDEIWISKPLPANLPIHRLVIVEIVVEDRENNEVLTERLTRGVQNIFAALAALGAICPDEASETLITTALGTGDAELPSTVVSKSILEATRLSMASAPFLRRLVIASLSEGKVADLSTEIDNVLGRKGFKLNTDAASILRPQLDSLKGIATRKKRWLDSNNLRIADSIIATQQILQAQEPEIDVDTLSGWMSLCRFLTESFLRSIMADNGWKKRKESLVKQGLIEFDKSEIHLTTNVKTEILAALLVRNSKDSIFVPEAYFEKDKPLARMIIEALHVLRVYGNQNAHLQKTNTIPKHLSVLDLQFMLSAMQLLLSCPIPEEK